MACPFKSGSCLKTYFHRPGGETYVAPLSLRAGCKIGLGKEVIKVITKSIIRYQAIFN